MYSRLGDLRRLCQRCIREHISRHGDLKQRTSTSSRTAISRSNIAGLDDPRASRQYLEGVASTRQRPGRRQCLSVSDKQTHKERSSKKAPSGSAVRNSAESRYLLWLGRGPSGCWEGFGERFADGGDCVLVASEVEFDGSVVTGCGAKGSILSPGSGEPWPTKEDRRLGGLRGSLL